MNKDLYVKNISFEATEEDLRKLFSLMGRITYIHMVTDPKSGKFLGCAYVKMENETQAKEALNLDGTLVRDRLINVAEALPQRPKEMQTKKFYPAKQKSMTEKGDKKGDPGHPRSRMDNKARRNRK